jgi:hypothetical protein
LLLLMFKKMIIFYPNILKKTTLLPINNTKPSTNFRK